MQKSRRDFLKATATTGAVLFATAVSLPVPPVLAMEKTETGDWKPASSPKVLPLNHQQILKHLRTANEVARETAEFGHHPFGAVLVAPDGETVLDRKSVERLWKDHVQLDKCIASLDEDGLIEILPGGGVRLPV